jgi:hypothetical protein
LPAKRMAYSRTGMFGAFQIVVDGKKKQLKVPGEHIVEREQRVKNSA